MTPREQLAASLNAFRAWDVEEEGYRRQMQGFLTEVPDCFLRSHLERHFTASALVVDPERQHVLLMHHRKLDRWLQPGGHADGEADLLAVARKEVAEETGLDGLEAAWEWPFDLDIHPIPERKGIPAHFHYDVRYLLQAPGRMSLQQNSESKGLAWFSLEEARRQVDSESVCRMLDKLEGGWNPSGPAQWL